MVTTNTFAKKLVHLDLKGLPPVPRRLIKLPEFFASLGIDGILVEWEDTFPYSSVPEMQAEYTYSMQTVREFLRRSKRLGLTVIPLVQTFGHLESLLKLKKYEKLQEHRGDPRDLCPLKSGSLEVINGMLADIIEVHKPFGLSHLHLGADEVWSLGSCGKCKKYVEENGKEKLFFHHINPLIDHVKNAGVQPIIWHDMLKKISPAGMKHISGRVDLMFWGYGDNRDDLWKFIVPENIKKCNSAGINCWAGGAYKGADGFDANLPNLARRAGNTMLWVELGRKYEFEGIALTAWSRYSTMSACCEPLEGCWESLALCMRILERGKYDSESDLKAVRRKLYGTVNPAKGCRKNKQLWKVYSALEELQKWSDKFDEFLKHRNFYYPQPDGRINTYVLSKFIKEMKSHLGQFDVVKKSVAEVLSGYASDKEIRMFLRSRIEPRKSLWKGIETELKKFL